MSDETRAVLRAGAGKTEQDGRRAAESLDALREDGAFALRAPQAPRDAETVARYLAGLGRACPSSAWVAGTCATAKNIAARFFPEPGRQEFLAVGPDALFCGSGVPAGRGQRVPGGLRVTGRWPNVSGCEDAAWASLALTVDGAPHFAVIPVADLAVDRTWQMTGMRGTGSHTLVADGTLVQYGAVASAAPFPLSDLLLYGITVLAPVAGAARGALDVTSAMFASERKPFMTAYRSMGESPGARQWLAEAACLVDRAERTMLAAAETLTS